MLTFANNLNVKKENINMNKTFISLLLCASLAMTASAQNTQKSELQQKAEAATTVPAQRYLHIRAYED